jgi:hypothetical protein
MSLVSLRSLGQLVVPLMILAAAIACTSEPPGPFDVVIDEYKRMSDFAEDAAPEPYVEGKVIVVNVGEPLSHHYRTAFTQDDDIEVRVGTVILLEWAKDVLDRNIAGVEFVRVRCEVIVIDRAKQRVVGRQEIVGTDPEGSHRWGSSPEARIVAFINGLPRRSGAQAPTNSTATTLPTSAPKEQPDAGRTPVGPAGHPYPPSVRKRFLDGCIQNSPRAFCECGIARFEEVMALDEFERHEAAISAGGKPSAEFMGVISHCRTVSR